MRGLRFDRILAGTALALVLATTCDAQERAPTAVEAGVPLPDRAALPPPTMLDLSAQPLDSETKSAVAPGATVDNETALNPADQGIVDKVHDLLTGKIDKIFASRKERLAVETFYQNRKGALLWIDNGAVNTRARAAIDHLKSAADEGLDPNDYKTPNFDAAQNNDALAEAELKLTATVLNLCAPSAGRTFPLCTRRQGHRRPTTAARTGRCARQDRRCGKCSPGPRGVQPATTGLQETQAKTGTNCVGKAVLPTSSMMDRCSSWPRFR